MKTIVKDVEFERDSLQEFMNANYKVTENGNYAIQSIKFVNGSEFTMFELSDILGELNGGAMKVSL